MTRARFTKLLALQEGTVITAFILLVVIFAIIAPGFLTGGNINNLLVNSMFVLLVATGMTFVLITGGIDLSVGSVMGLGGAITGYLLIHGVPVGVALAAGLAAGAVVGLVNGLLIARLGLADFIVTLAMLSLVRGIVELMTAGSPLRGFASPTFNALAAGTVGPIPLPLIIAAVVVALAAFVLRSTVFGRSLFALGINRQAAHLSGIDVGAKRVQAYIVSGVLAAAAGIFLSSYLSAVQPEQGSGYELTAIAAAVIGGTSLAGGKGTIWGTVIGALMLGTLQNGLVLAGLNSFWFTIVTGIFIVAAVVLDRVLRLILSARTGRAAGSAGAA